ncbi:MAG: oligosaccharide flippase family protein, partial [Oscillospiraceae bacterium]|nr:oligosaccharide flippase family protein [Oscillospiraceae bacterium]
MGSQPSTKSIMSSLFWKFGERITAQLVSLLVSIILARMLTPDDYGSVALVMVFITIANVFVSSGFGNALIQKNNADDLDFSSVFFINIAVAIVIYAVLFVCAPIIAEFYKMPVLCPVLRVLSVRIPVAAVNSIQHAYVSRNMMFRKFFWSALFGTVLSGFVGIIMAYNGFGIWALVWQYLTNACTDTFVLWFTVKWRPIFKFSLERAKTLISFGWKLLVSALLDTINIQLR